MKFFTLLVVKLLQSDHQLIEGFICKWIFFVCWNLMNWFLTDDIYTGNKILQSQFVVAKYMIK